MSLVQTVPAPGAQTDSADADGRWAGTGSSILADSVRAGDEAAGAALAGRTAVLLIVLCSIRHDAPALLEAVRRRAAADTVIVGCSTMGELTSEGPLDGGVVVMAFGGAGFQARVRVSHAASADRRTAGAHVAEVFDELDLPHGVLLLLCDGVSGQQHEIVRGAHSVVGAAVPLVGGCAADDLTYSRTLQFAGDGTGVEVLTDAVVGVAVGSQGSFGIGVEHGWTKRGAALVVTSSRDGIIEELDGRPAAEAYFEHTGMSAELMHDPAAFREAAFLWPLGLSRRTGEDIRVIHAADPDTGFLTCLADVPQGALVWVMQADPAGLIEAGRTSVAAALQALDGAPAVGLVVFDCGARKAKLTPAELREEVAELSAAAGSVPLGGLYTYGEIARTSGTRGMHHLTCVTLALS